MTDSADLLTLHPDGDDLHSLDMLADKGPLPTRAPRHDGWTPVKQRKFLEMLAEGHTITNICHALGMSVTAAYALRRSARGAAFALGWQAALLLAREHLADKLLERAVHGSVETITRPDGSCITRQRHDNRLAMHMLTRLDRLSERESGPADHAAARLVAGEFEPFLDLVEQEGGAARAGLFLARRLGAEGVDGAADDLAPVRLLARADAWLRTRADPAAGDAVAIADLDPAQRAGWTAEQWARAEAAGLLTLAPPPPAETVHEPKLPKLYACDNPSGDPVWWNSAAQEWRTSFPPPDDFYGEEEGHYGEEGYARTLTLEEEDVIEAPIRAELAARRAREAELRDAFFAEEEAAAEAEAAEAATEAYGAEEAEEAKEPEHSDPLFPCGSRKEEGEIGAPATALPLPAASADAPARKRKSGGASGPGKSRGKPGVGGARGRSRKAPALPQGRSAPLHSGGHAPT
ncbi:hypothetical protein ACNFJ7_09490 [Sphingomonas sp. HT-1]|uniref:hypothetical protein n=1 Tax=unclassified Sphingomonas TaxID=196159 RepID=UPI0002DDABD9|nr:MULTISPECIES: hypothetical protein [unclassified Sphingomonas]KTF67335.1 hypothetical protein ATB93_17825 [Sphingomonas sp. WG]